MPRSTKIIQVKIMIFYIMIMIMIMMQITNNTIVATNVEQMQISQDKQKKSEKQPSYQCVYNLDYEITKEQQQKHNNTKQNMKKNRLLLSQTKINLKQKQHNQQQEQDQRIITNKDYNAYLQKYKPYEYYTQQHLDSYSQRIKQIYAYKRQIFLQNIEKIVENNGDFGRGYLMGLNLYTDVGEQQFYKRYVSQMLKGRQVRVVQTQTRNLQSKSPPPVPQTQKNIFKSTHIDWQCKTKQVYNQGSCNACYAFSTIDALEISLRITSPKNQDLPSLAIMEILSCARNGISLLGCQGGYYEEVYQYVRDFGIGLSGYYPFNGERYLSDKQDITEEQCNKQIINGQKYKNNKYYIKGYKNIRKDDCYQIIQVLKKQVLVVTIYSKGLKQYKSGIFTPEKSIEKQKDSKGHPDHGVTLIGYHPQMKYKIKNSWGREWGQNGFGYVGREAGVCKLAIYPIIE